MDNIRLNPVQEKLVTENEKLVYHVIKSFRFNHPEDYDDIKSIGKIGLIKAAITFDESKKNKFSSYAIQCIKNEVLMYIRKKKKGKNTVSLDDIFNSYDDSGRELKIKDTIVSPESDFVDRQIKREDCIKCISIILNVIKPQYRTIILYCASGITEVEMAKKINATRSWVSRLRSNAIKIIKIYFMLEQKYDEFFNVDISEEQYQISFYSKNQSLFKEISEYVKNVTLKEKIQNFNVNYDGERIIINISADLESLYYIAQIADIIDNY